MATILDLNTLKQGSFGSVGGPDMEYLKKYYCCTTTAEPLDLPNAMISWQKRNFPSLFRLVSHNWPHDILNFFQCRYHVSASG